MTPNTVYWTVTESNILANDAIATQSYPFFDKAQAYAKLYSIWSYAAAKPADNPVQCMSIYMIETSHDRAIMLESKVFDYRTYPTPEPEPEPESETEPESNE